MSTNKPSFSFVCCRIRIFLNLYAIQFDHDSAIEYSTRVDHRDKKDHPTWGDKITEFLVSSLRGVMNNQFDHPFAIKKNERTPVGKKRKEGVGRKGLRSGKYRRIVKISQTDKVAGRAHLSQREIAQELNVSQSLVNKILKRNLKCFRRVKAQVLTDAHKKRRLASAKHPDINPCDFFMWGKMLHELAKRSRVKNTDSLKVALLEI